MFSQPGKETKTNKREKKNKKSDKPDTFFARLFYWYSIRTHGLFVGFFFQINFLYIKEDLKMQDRKNT